MELPPSLPSVIACLVVGANSASTLDGVSRGIATQEDRARFRTLRHSPELGAIVVGSRTAESEPYAKTPHPLFIYRRSTGLSPGAFIDEMCERITGAILCEGGVTLIHQLLTEESLDSFYLTRTHTRGDGHFLDEDLLLAKMSLTSREEVNGTTFERYERASRLMG